MYALYACNMPPASLKNHNGAVLSSLYALRLLPDQHTLPPFGRIVGGTNSSPGAWPWQAAMYRDGEYQCGATLISDRWLLSAGHCYLR